MYFNFERGKYNKRMNQKNSQEIVTYFPTIKIDLAPPNLGRSRTNSRGKGNILRIILKCLFLDSFVSA